jgi:hypothetical protein
MCTIARSAASELAGAQASQAGGLVALRAAWAALDGDTLGAGALPWRGRAGALLLFALVALPLLGCTSLRAIATCCRRLEDPLWAALGWAEAVSQRRLARFVTQRGADWAGVQAAMVQRLAQHPATALPHDGILAVDSTVIEKRFGPQLPGRRPVYDNVRRRLVDGWDVVSGCVVGPRGAWPLGLLPHQPPVQGRAPRRRRAAQAGELPSKLDLARQLVASAVAAPLGLQAVVGDGAFSVNWWLRAVAELGVAWLVATRQDRRLRIGATVQSIAAWAAAAPAAWPCVAERRDGGRIYGGLLPPATLLDKGCQQKGLACRPAYFERRDRQGRVRHRWYLVTSQLAWDAPTLWAYWERRWAIEVFHRDAKQSLQLAAMHGRHWAGLVAWLAACSLRASLLAFLRATDPAWGAYSTGALARRLYEAACGVRPAARGPSRFQAPRTLPPLPAALAAALDHDPAWPLAQQEAA